MLDPFNKLKGQGQNYFSHYSIMGAQSKPDNTEIMVNSKTEIMQHFNYVSYCVS